MRRSFLAALLATAAALVSPILTSAARAAPAGQNPPTPVMDGQGNIGRPWAPLYTGGTPVEGSSWPLAAVNATTGPLGMTGYGNLNFTVSGTWSGTLTFQANPSLDNTSWTPVNCTPLAGATPVSATTANGAWTCPNLGDAPLRATLTSFTSGTATVTASKGQASSAMGLPLIASPAAWNATQITNDFQGYVVNPGLLTLAYSTLPSEAVNGVLGGYGASVATDPGNGASAGSGYSYYAESGAQTIGGYTNTLYTPASSLNPFSASGSTLVYTAQYDAANSRWTAIQIQLNSEYYYQTDGYSAPPYGSYVEFQVQFPPLAALSGTCFWFGAYATNGSNYSNQAGQFNSNPNVVGHIEHDAGESCIQNYPYGITPPTLFSTMISHHHQFGVNSGQPFQPGVPQSERSIASSQFMNPFADSSGSAHYIGIFYTKNFWCSVMDRRVQNCELKPQQLENIGLMTPKLLIALAFAPTIANGTTFQIKVLATRVWICPNAESCPFIVN